MRAYEIFKPPLEGSVIDPKTGAPVPAEELEAFGRMAGNFSGLNTQKSPQGFTIERLPGASTPIRHDSFDVFDRHMHNVARLIEMQPQAKMAGEIIRSPAFGDKFGQWGQKLLNEWLNATVTDGRGNNMHRWPWLDLMRKASNRSMVFFRLASNIKHVSAIPQGLVNSGGPQYWYRGIHEQFTSAGRDFLNNFPQVMERQAGDMSYAEIQRTILKDPDKFFPKAMELGDRYGFILGKEIDAVNSRAVFIGRYLRNLEDKGQAPTLDGAIDQQAAYNAMIFMRRTVSSTLQKDVQPVLGRGMGSGGNVSFARTMNAFRQYALERFSLVAHDIPQAFKSGNYTRGAALIAAMTAAGLYESNVKKGVDKAWSLLFGNKETENPKDTWAHRLLMDSVSIVPYANNVISAVQWRESGIPVLDNLVNLGSQAGRVETAKTPAAKERAAVPALGKYGSAVVDLDGALGLPASFLDEAFGPLADAIEAKKLVYHLSDNPVALSILKDCVHKHLQRAA